MTRFWKMNSNCTLEFICTYTNCIVQNFYREKFDGYRLFKYLMEEILTDGRPISPCICKCCNASKWFIRVNFGYLTGNHQKCQQFTPSQFCVMYVYATYIEMQ